MRFCCLHDTYTPLAPCLLSSSRTHSLARSYAGFHKYLCVLCCVVYTYTVHQQLPAFSQAVERTVSLAPMQGFHKYFCVLCCKHIHCTPAAPCLLSSSRTHSLSRSCAGVHNTYAFMLYTHAPTAPCPLSSSRTQSLAILQGFLILKRLRFIHIHQQPPAFAQAVEHTVSLALMQGFIILMLYTHQRLKTVVTDIEYFSTKWIIL